MKERPILFSSPMIRAILDGRKTQTRRIVNPQPAWIAEPFVPFKTADADPNGIINCPYGRRGDRLYIKEPHYLFGKWYKNGKTATGRQKWRFIYDKTPGVRFPDNKPEHICIDKVQIGWFKRSALFMPKWAARNWLEITGIRVERLRDINEEDAMAEGCNPYMLPCHPDVSPFKAGYSQLWESINGAGSWEANPWVWVIEFKRIRP